MPPLFYVSPHSYARDGLSYLNSMHSLPENSKIISLRGEHNVQHKPRVFRGI